MKRTWMLILFVAVALPLASYSANAQTPDRQDSLSLTTDSPVTTKNTAAADSIPSGRKGLFTPPSKAEDTTLYQVLTGRKLIWAILVLLVAYIGIRILMRLLVLFSEKSTRYRITIKGLMPLIRVVAWSAVLLFVITAIFQPSMAALITLSASVGVAIGFAAQDILKNIFGGIVIIFDQPFKVGDKIEVGKYYGEVTEIGLRSTRLVTADDSLVTVPNSEIMNQSVSNANSGELNCQVVAEIYLPLDIDTIRVREIAIEIAQTSKYVYLKKPIAVLFFQEVKEKRTYYKMRLKAYVLDIRYEFVFKSELTELMVSELIREGILSPEF